jgi:SAM-dependent methyltransferase
MVVCPCENAPEMTTATSYDQVIYLSRPQSVTHPNGLAALGVLHGLSPAPVERCRILEIGCATGGNIFGIAEAYPNSEVVGIDPSRRQIEVARQASAALGLANLRLEPAGAEQLDEGWGKFDYIICHGVYSWVPAGVRDAILACCRRLLAPHGIAYVSYNAKPGWYLRLPVREMMQFHTRAIEDPRERIGQARALLRFIDDNLFNPEVGWARLVRDEAKISNARADFYVVHEHLEADNEAFYFHEFMTSAASHALSYLCEAAYHAHPSVLPEKVRESLAAAGLNDLLQLEQYIDFLGGRMFRRTLLVHREVEVGRTTPASHLGQLQMSAMARPMQDGPFAVCSTEPVRFQNDESEAIVTDEPPLKAAFMELLSRWPASLSWDELWRGCQARLAEGGIATGEGTRAALGQAMLRLFWSNLVALHAGPLPFTTAVSERPTASRLARLQASAGVPICSRRHRTVSLAPFDEALLTLLDGTRDKMAIAEELSRRASPPTPAEALVPEVGRGLERLARAALLVA